MTKIMKIIWTSIIIMSLSMMAAFISVHAATANEEVVFATIDDLSGPYASSGEEAVKATVVALEEVGYKVLGKKIRHITRDTQLKPEVGVRKFREVVEQEHPVFVNAGGSSAVQLAMMPFAEETKTLFWTEALSTALTSAGTVNRYTFRYVGNDYAMANSCMSEFMKKFPEAKTFSAVTMDYVWGQTMFNDTKAVIEKLGGKVIENVLTPVREEDYTGAITKALLPKPDVLVIIQYGAPLTKCARTAHEFGAKQRAKVFISMDGLDMCRGIGSEALEGMYTSHAWWHEIKNSFSKEFVDKFKKKYGKVPSEYGLSHYMSVWLTLKAMERCKSTDVNKVICALEGYKYNGPTGREEIQAFDHQVAHPLFLGVGKKLTEKKYEDDYVEIISSGRVYQTHEQNPVVWKLKLPCDKK